MWKKGIALSMTVAMLAACNSDGGDNSAKQNNNPSTSPETSQTTPEDNKPLLDLDKIKVEKLPFKLKLDKYNLANECVALKPAEHDKWLVEDDGKFVASANSAAEASAFYMKASNLGEYMFYSSNETLLKAKGNDPTNSSSGLSGFGLSQLDAPADQASWKVNHGVLWEVEEDEYGFSFTSRAHDPENSSPTLMVNSDGELVVETRSLDEPENQRFKLSRVKDCAEFPEMETNTIGDTYKGQGVDQPVVGFADIHSHISATDFLGGARVGNPFSQYGVPQALPQGNEEHGLTGFFDLIGNIYGGNPFDLHDTQGWPTFNDWPANDRLTYENTYYKWIERAHKAGLRLVVNNLVQNDVLCHLNHVLQTLNPNDPDLIGKVKKALAASHVITKIPDSVLDGMISDALEGTLDGAFENTCNSMKSAVKQADFMYRMEKYIDAQHGGPDKGWFRIVTSPEEAREVINDGKLAMVLGIEVSDVLDCKVTRVSALGLDLMDQPHCDENDIKSQLDLLYDIGVRQINLVHEFNNALGGNGIFDGGFINLGNFIDTGEFFQTEKCPNEEYFYSANVDEMLSVDPFSYIGDNPITELLSGLAQGILPIYSSNPSHCNKRGITDLGRFALQQVMDKKMMVDVDHMSVKMKGQVIDEAIKQEYPVISTHGGHGGITMQQATDILNTGGVINPIAASPESFKDHLDKLSGILPESRVLASSFTSDINGMAAQPGPSDTKIQYPFTLFEGAEWGDKFANIEPITFEQAGVPQSDRLFDYNEEGIAHYGLYADWVEAVRLHGGADALDALYSSAEDYIRAWELAENR